MTGRQAADRLDSLVARHVRTAGPRNVIGGRRPSSTPVYSCSTRIGRPCPQASSVASAEGRILTVFSSELHVVPAPQPANVEHAGGRGPTPRPLGRENAGREERSTNVKQAAWRQTACDTPWQARDRPTTPLIIQLPGQLDAAPSRPKASGCSRQLARPARGSRRSRGGKDPGRPERGKSSKPSRRWS